jgi:hypothetical protein
MQQRFPAMKNIEYVQRIEAIIAEHQQVQMVNPASSAQWQNASAEINRLAKPIVAQNRAQY